MATKINLIDLYSFYNDIDASVIETLMEDYNISCSIRSLGGMHLSPNAGDFLEKRISVEAEKLDNAKKIILDAIKSGVISREGKFRL